MDSTNGSARTPHAQDILDAWHDYKQGFMTTMKAEVRFINTLADVAYDVEKRMGPSFPQHRQDSEMAGKLVKANEAYNKKMTTQLNIYSAKMKNMIQQYAGIIKHPPINENKYLASGLRKEHNLTNLVIMFLNIQSTMISTYSDTVACLNSVCPCCSVKVGQSHEPECSLKALQTYLHCAAQAPYEAASDTASPHHGAPQRLYVRGNNPHLPPQAPFLHPLPPMNIPPPVGVYGMTAVHQATPQFPGQEARAIHCCTESHFLAKEPLRHPNTYCEMYTSASPTPNQEYRQLTVAEAAAHSANNCEGIRGHSPNYPDPNRAMQAEMKGPLPPPGMLNTMFRSPHNYLMSPLEGQRRWSEAAAAEIGASSVDDGVMRRWSMPYEGRAEAYGHLPHMLHPPPPHHNLRHVRPPPPHMHSYERSRSVTPEWQMGANGTVHLASAADGLVDALQLLSHRPSSHTMHNPTPNNTTPSHSIHQGIAEVWPEEGPTSGFESVPHELQRKREMGGPEAAAGAPRTTGFVGTPQAIPQSGEPMREFTLFGANDTLSCLRNVTACKENPKN